MKRALALVAAAWATAMVGAGPVAAGATGATCAPADHPGGDWPSLNHDLRNSRHQDRERVIGVQEASSLRPVWRFSVAAAGGEGGFQSTPVVAGGCVYVSASAALNDGDPTHLDDHWSGTSTIYALNADTGELVWQTPVNGSSVGLASAGGRVHAFPFYADEPGSPSGFPEPAGAHVVALDGQSGEMLWSSGRLDDGKDGRNGSWLQSSPVVFKAGSRSLVFAPLSDGYGDGARVPLYFIDARTGRMVRRFYALSEEDYREGYGGAGIWSTAAFDSRTRHLYAPTADSEGYRKQHPYNNAILRIDADPSRRTFGSVVDAYSGTSEHYDVEDAAPEAFRANPACERATDQPDQRLPFFDNSASTECVELDLDFGASPNLFSDSRGHTVVTALQKSGIFHAAYAHTMQPAWARALSTPNAASNSATATVDGSTIFTLSTQTLFSLDGTLGAANWLSTNTASAFGYQPLSSANGVVYALSNPGTLVALDAATGRVLLNRPISLDVDPQSCLGAGSGVAIARNTVYAPCDGQAGNLEVKAPGWLVAYRPASSP